MALYIYIITTKILLIVIIIVLILVLRQFLTLYLNNVLKVIIN